MSSPLADLNKSLAKRLLVGLHRRASHSERIEYLVAKLSVTLQSVFPQGSGVVRCLDVGCGDMTLAERLGALADYTDWSCIDIHPLPAEMEGEKRWRKYRQFDGRSIPLADKSVDLAMMCDTLHHAGDSIGDLMREASRVARFVIVKDCFEYSQYSRTVLRAVDFLGNWGYGVPIPSRYFTQASFAHSCEEAGLGILSMDTDVAMYSHIPVLGRIIRPEWQFVALLDAR